ncbi:MAG: hypothetical protein J6S90_04655 [Lentisphaeria bacterium]|nr:hypothetical protein [Lentisphaeria bacterium]
MIDVKKAIIVAEGVNSPYMPNFKARKVWDCKTFWSVTDTKQSEFSCNFYIHKKTGEVRGGSVLPFDWIENAEEFDPVVVYEE